MNKTMHKVYSPLNQDNLEKAFSDLNRDQNEYVDLKHFEVEDKMIMIYKERDKTQPPEEDINKLNQPEMQTSQNPRYNQQEENQTLLEKAKQFWFILLPLGLFIIWWFFMRAK